jgi:class 3 adenylate cyclase
MSRHLPNDGDYKGSEVRLWRLIDDRLSTNDPEARKRIDERIWDLFGEDWAIMFTDLSGFSRSVATFGIIHFLQIIHEHKRLLLPIVESHDGILIKIEADSFLIIFRKARSALACAIEMQHACQKVNVGRVPEEQILLCLGIGAGRIVRIGDRDVFGNEVNASSKLGEDTAKANEILITKAAREAIGDYTGVKYEELGIPIPGTDQAYKVIYQQFGG